MFQFKRPIWPKLLNIPFILKQRISLKVTTIIFFLLISLYGVVLWLSAPMVVYESYDTVVNTLGVTNEIVLSEPDQEPVSQDFSLLIPKIKINAPVIANVDGGNPREYLWRVTQGIAHFKRREYANLMVDGAFPGEKGNIFLFGHSQIPGGDTSQFKGVFNQLHQLVRGDRVVVVYQGARYEYQVMSGQVVSKNELTYLAHTDEETLTLMTCWPLGLDLQRYIIRAVRIRT